MIHQHFKVDYDYPVYFAEEIFHPENNQFAKIFDECGIVAGSKFLFVIDSNVAKSHPDLNRDLSNFFTKSKFTSADVPLIIEGGEASKNDFGIINKILEAIDRNKIDRHSFVVGIGGGALLDVVGFAAAIA
ncbi:MAG TPA: 3-dehydroquinate synthase, partial [Bacteroidia bacterium]|nr:3-dehydroquinate synthase [Bacteroidia bacterium]